MFCHLKGLFRGVKGLGEVGDDVVDVLEADRQADQVGTDAGRFQLLVVHLAVGGGGGVEDAGDRVGDVGLDRAEFQVLHEGLGRL